MKKILLACQKNRKRNRASETKIYGAGLGVTASHETAENTGIAELSETAARAIETRLNGTTESGRTQADIQVK